jgi:hypothetical protein
VSDLAKLVAAGARNAGPPPIRTLTDGLPVKRTAPSPPAAPFALGGHVLVGVAILDCYSGYDSTHLPTPEPRRQRTLARAT